MQYLQDTGDIFVVFLVPSTRCAAYRKSYQKILPVLPAGTKKPKSPARLKVYEEQRKLQTRLEELQPRIKQFFVPIPNARERQAIMSCVDTGGRAGKS